MRRRAAAPLATLLAATLVLAGCGSGDEPETDPTDQSEQTPDAAAPQASADDVAALEAVTVEGDLGAPATLGFETPFEVEGPVARVDTPGDGEPLEEGQLLRVHYVAVSGDDASEMESTWESDATRSISFTDAGLVPALKDVFTGQNVGVRILFAAPGNEAIEATDTSPALEARPTSLLALEVVSADFPRARGTAVEPPDGLPVVTLANDGEPSIEIPDGLEEPTELVVQPLIEGDGPEVESGQLVQFQYSGWLWDGTAFDSSWERQPFDAVIDAGQLIQGWDQGIVGQKVGSQLLLLVPSDLGYGAEGSGTIPGDASLIFVVDILDATDAG